MKGEGVMKGALVLDKLLKRGCGIGEALRCVDIF